MSDYMFLLESHLDAAQSRAMTEMQRIATEAGMNVWLTGGAMRDVLRGSIIQDLDFTVERDALKLGRELTEALGGSIIAEDSLKRSVELLLPGEIRASVSNARSEKYAKPGGKPQIAPAGIHADLLRRDFTINAIGLSLNRGSRGLLVDPANGQADVINMELRAANPYIFFDDPSRIFRLVRFEHTLGYQITPRLRSQLENALAEGYHKLAPASALAAEIRALAGLPNADAALDSYDRLGVLPLISPALTGPKLNTAGIARYDKLVQAVLPMGTRGGWLAFLRILTDKLTTRERADVLTAFALPKAEAEGLKKLDAEAKKLEAALKSASMTRPSHVYEALSQVSVDTVLMVLCESPARLVQDRIRAYYQKYLPMAQEITEDQVMATGVKPGTPKYDKAFRSMVTAHLNARPKKPVLEAEPAAAAAAEAGGRAVQK